MNSSTFSNWCKRLMPRVSLPAAAFSRRKHGVWATKLIGTSPGSRISSRNRLAIGTSAVGTIHRSSSSSWYIVSANLGS